jgi:hypothetical protein
MTLKWSRSAIITKPELPSLNHSSKKYSPPHKLICPVKFFNFRVTCLKIAMLGII